MQGLSVFMRMMHKRTKPQNATGRPAAALAPATAAAAWLLQGCCRGWQMVGRGEAEAAAGLLRGCCRVAANAVAHVCAAAAGARYVMAEEDKDKHV